MSGKKRVSICIPTYNQTGFLRKTLDSVASQTFRDFEVIVTDDSTGNDVGELVATYQNRFQLIYTRNLSPLGSPANWNLALSMASGEYIKMMHHDDWFAADDSLLQFTEVLDRDPSCGFVFCNSEVLNVRDNTVSFHAPGSMFMGSLYQDPKVLFNNNQVGSPSAVMFRNGPQRFDEKLKYLVDVEFYIRLLTLNRKFVHINRPLIVNTSHHQGQVTFGSQNRETQVGEYAYLYNKVFNGKIPDLELSRFFLFLFRNYKIISLEEIESFGYPAPQPAWYFRLLLYYSKLRKN